MRRTKAIARFIGMALVVILISPSASGQTGFHCPPVGTKVVYTDGRERIFEGVSDDHCDYVDAQGVPYALFADFTSASRPSGPRRWAGKGVETLWPLRVGKSVKFYTSLMPEGFIYNEKITVVKEETVVVAGDAYRTFVLLWQESDRGYDAETTWWYSPDLGLVVKSSRKCNIGARCIGETWEIASVVLPTSRSSRPVR